MKKFNQYITEGGQFGHLNNIWEVGNLTVDKMIEIINQSLDLKFDFAELKLDSVALSFTVREDGKVVGSRNKGQSRNFGATGLDIQAMAAKFKGHNLEFAYTWAIRNLQMAVTNLSAAQKTKIFNNGRNWMAVEVLGWGASNIIDYGGVKELTLLGTIEHDQDGNKIGSLNKENARAFDGMLRQKSAEQQSKFAIKNVSRATFNDIQNSGNLKKELIGRLRKIMSGAKTIDDFKMRGVTKILHTYTSDKILINKLLTRWVHFDKSINIREIYKTWPDDKSWIQKMEKEVGSIIKKIILPVEKVFLKLGAEVVGALNVFKSSDPTQTAKKLRKDFSAAVSKLQASNDEKIIKKLAMELKRLEAAGGTGAIAPEEGITFFIDNGGERTLVKLTGTFAPVNQIIGLLFNIVGR